MTHSHSPQAEGGISPQKCPLCGGANGCPLASGNVYRGCCWCESVDFPDPLLSRVPEAARRIACICRSCIDHSSLHSEPEDKVPDFYIDQDSGFQVFTEAYHRRRGYCCHSGCRHCPWTTRRQQPVPSGSLLLVLLWIGLFAVLGIPLSKADTWTEDFSTNPESHGWTSFGDASLFRWRPDVGDLQVTWDTAHVQSFFAHPLGRVLTTRDNFGLSLDLRLNTIQPGLRINRPGAMQISLGWLNLTNALTENYLRAGGRAADLLEWDWFPKGFIPGYGEVDPTVSPVAFDNLGQVAASFTFPFDLATNTTYRLYLDYSATNRQMSLALDVDGAHGPSINSLILSDSFGSFNVDAFAVMVWNEGSSPFDSLYAVGAIDNLILTLPPLPIDSISWVAGSLSQVQFSSQLGWNYSLEASADLVRWIPVSDSIPGTGHIRFLTDSRTLRLGHQFYRVSASRP